MGKSLGSGNWLLLGSAMGPRCACRREAGVGRGGRGVNGRGPPHHVISLCCLLQGLQEGQGLRIGLLVALGECHGAEVRVLSEAVVVWCYDANTAEDANLTEGDMHLARTPISTPPSAPVSRRSRGVPGTLVLPDRGSGGRQRGLEGGVEFADRDLEKMAEVFLVCCLYFVRPLGPISLRIDPFPP